MNSSNVTLLHSYFKILVIDKTEKGENREDIDSKKNFEVSTKKKIVRYMVHNQN